MAVEFARAQAREVLAASQHTSRAQPGKKIPRVDSSFAWILGDDSRSHHAARSFECKIEHRSKVDVKSKSAAALSDNLPVLAEEFSIAAGEYVCCCGRGAEHAAKAIHGTALKVDAGKQRRRNALLTIAQQSPGLLGTLYVPCEQNDARRLQSREQGTEAPRHLRAVEADDQKLADVLRS